MKPLIIIFFILGWAFAWFPKIVWTYWDDPLQQSNNFIRAFHRNHEQFTKGWQLRHLDRNNMWEWLGQIPLLKQRLQSEVWKNEGRAKISDIIRMAVVNHYGGVYFDKTTILTRDLNWILDLSNKNLFFINESINDQPQVFIHYAKHSTGPKIYDEKTKYGIPIIPNFESSFMAAKPNSKFLTEWLDRAFRWKEQSYKLYGSDWTKSLINQRAIGNNTPISFVYEGNNYYQVIICGASIVMDKQKQLQALHNITKIEPLALKYYKLMLMNTNDSGYTHQRRQKQIKLQPYLNTMTIAELKQKQIYAEYFVKICKGDYELINSDLLLPNFLCFGNFYILEDSIMYQFLLRFYGRRFYFKDVVKSPRDRFRFYCPVTAFLVFMIFVLAISVKKVIQKVKRQKKKLQKFIQLQIKQQVTQNQFK